MGEDRLPRQILYGQLPNGQRNQGGPMKRHKYQAKTTLKKCGIEPATLEATASDRQAWRSACKQGLTHLEESIHEAREERRQRRHNRIINPPNNPGLQCHLCGKVCAAPVGLRSHLRWHGRQQEQQE